MGMRPGYLLNVLNEVYLGEFADLEITSPCPRTSLNKLPRVSFKFLLSRFIRS
jgi:hypothetical protein